MQNLGPGILQKSKHVTQRVIKNRPHSTSSNIQTSTLHYLIHKTTRWPWFYRTSNNTAANTALHRSSVRTASKQPTSLRSSIISALTGAAHLSPTMITAIPAVLTLAYLSAVSSALPSALNQDVSLQTEPNAPRTLLGKPYRRRWNSQDCPPPCWTLSVTDRNDSDADTDAGPDTLAVPDYTSAYQAPAGDDGWTPTKMYTKPRVPLPLPLVLNASPESVSARLRLMKSKRPLRHSPCSDDAPPSRNEDQDRIQPLVVSGSKGKTGSLEAQVPERSKRLYDRGEWKSRLFEKY